MAHGILSGRDREDRAEHGADAGRPTESKGQADNIGADQPRRPRVGVIARLAVQKRNVDDAEEMQSGNDDDHAGDLGEDRQVLDHELAQHRGRGAQDDEHRSETEHEGDRGQHHGLIDMGRRLVLARQLVEGRAAEKAEIGRHERQHAGAQKAEEARQ